MDKREQQEHEANLFALALLMPKENLLYELRRFPIDLSDEKSERMIEIAKKFGVSLNALVFRLMYMSQYDKTLQI